MAETVTCTTCGDDVDGMEAVWTQSLAVADDQSDTDGDEVRLEPEDDEPYCSWDCMMNDHDGEPEAEQ